MGIRTKLCEARGFGVSRSRILRSTDAMTPYRERDRYGAFAVQLLISAAFSLAIGLGVSVGRALARYVGPPCRA